MAIITEAGFSTVMLLYFCHGLDNRYKSDGFTTLILFLLYKSHNL